MKRIRTLILAALAVFFFTATAAEGQNHIRQAMRRARERQEARQRENTIDAWGFKPGGGYLGYRVIDGDTTYFDSIEPVWVFARGANSRKDWRKYYKLVYYFARVYPYAEASARLQEIVDSTIAANHMNLLQKEKYLNKIQAQLFKDFEGVLRHMTISQGAVLLKLIDRETGQSSYSIIKDYKSGIAAGFWQGVAKVFKNDLKSQYDPEGEDKDLEELVQHWKAGTFRRLYYSIFWEDPPDVKVPDFYK